MKSRFQQRGLTLPEVLIAVAILAAIAATIAPSIRAATKVTLGVEQSAASREETRTSQDVLETLAASAIHAGTLGDPLTITGQGQRFVFLAYGPMESPVSVTLRADANGLLLEVDPFIKGTNTPYTTELLSSVQELSFSYFGQLDRDKPRLWHQNWNSDRPPKLLRLTGTIVERAGPAPFTLDLVMGGQAPLTCAFDPVSRTCRNTS